MGQWTPGAQSTQDGRLGFILYTGGVLEQQENYAAINLLYFGHVLSN